MLRSRLKVPLLCIAVWSALSACCAVLIAASHSLPLWNTFLIWLIPHTGPFLFLSLSYGHEWYRFSIAMSLCLGPIAPHLYRPGRWTRLWAILGVTFWFLAGWLVIFSGF